MNRVFVTSDTHFGHVNIIKYCNRPFPSVHAMNEALIERWNSRVDKDDEVFFLGDFAMGPGVNTEFVRNILRRLNGVKIVTLGNHDMPSKYGRGLEDMVAGFPEARMIISRDSIYRVDFEGKKFVMCHFPIQEWEGKDHGAIHLHGHTHTEFPLDPKVQLDLENSLKRDRVYDIGVDMYGGPVQITGDCRYLNDPKGWQ